MKKNQNHAHYVQNWVMIPGLAPEKMSASIVGFLDTSVVIAGREGACQSAQYVVFVSKVVITVGIVWNNRGMYWRTMRLMQSV
mmetsp:Transcript_29296/g.39086  ORF Transcript_29296/g.39086 Transcript_29296/m.39086 type:complete len:83 (-) Transcript_29296:395-643(-)